MDKIFYGKSKNEAYLYEAKKKRIEIIAQKPSQKIILGIIIDTALRIPPNTGVTYRLYYLSKKLAQKGVKVKIFLCNRNFENDETVKNLLQENLLEFHVIPVKVFYNVGSMEDIITKAHVNILQTEDSVSFLHFQKIAQVLNIPLCLEMHDVEASLKESLSYSSKEVNITKAISFFACTLAEKIICMTPLDYNELVYKIGVNPIKLNLIPNPVDLGYFHYYGPNTKLQNIIFLGNMFYWPNQHAVELIASKIYPKLYRTFKNIKFVFIGMFPDRIKRKLTKANLFFTDSIEDLNSILKSATIALCPVTEGSGMKVKILNYCAAGLPVITTQVGASGYEKIKSLIIENDLTKYPKIIKDLLKNHGKMSSLGKKNRENVEKYYSLDSVANKMKSTYQVLLSEFSSKKKARRKNTFELPFPLYLNEKRIKEVKNENYYIIKNGEIKTKTGLLFGAKSNNNRRFLGGQKNKSAEIFS